MDKLAKLSMARYCTFCFVADFFVLMCYLVVASIGTQRRQKIEKALLTRIIGQMLLPHLSTNSQVYIHVYGPVAIPHLFCLTATV